MVNAARGEAEIPSRRGRAAIVLLGCVLAAVIAIGVQISAGSQVIRRNLLIKEEVPPDLIRGDGLVNPPDLSYGLADPAIQPDGTNARWTTEHATLNFPFAANMGRNVELFIRLAGKREPGQTPADVKISINSRPVLTFTADNNYAVYDLQLDTAKAPNPNLHPADVQVDIESTTFRAPDLTQHGVAIDWVELHLDRSRTEVIVETVVWCIFAALVLLAASLRLGLLWGATYSASMLVAFAVLHFTYVPRAIPLATEIGLAGLAWTVASVIVPKRHPWIGLALVAMGLWLVVGGRVLQDWEVDDAYILVPLRLEPGAWQRARIQPR